MDGRMDERVYWLVLGGFPAAAAFSFPAGARSAATSLRCNRRAATAPAGSMVREWALFGASLPPWSDRSLAKVAGTFVDRERHKSGMSTDQPSGAPKRVAGVSIRPTMNLKRGDSRGDSRRR